MLQGEEYLEALSRPKKIIITTHHKPDGDALGSSLGLYHWLKGKGHDVNVVLSSDFPDFLSWMPGFEDLIYYPDQPEESQKLFDEAEIIFCLDYSALSRTNILEPIIREAKGQKWMIDHHLDPEDFATVEYWDSSAAATAQLVYTFIADVYHDKESITAEIASCLYAGIMTDTGSFRFRSTTSAVHHIIANLIDAGAKNWEIHENIYNSSTENRLKFLGYSLLNCLEVIPEYHTALFSLTKEDLLKFNVSTGDTEGLVNYALSIKGIRLAGLFIDRTELIKLSLRSIGDIPCNEICRKYFNGGGHLNASGGNSTDSLEEVVAKFKSILPEYKSYLT
ncbi:exopolyphosphatase [Sphingobacterium mizutaii NBRC 14946 = DSM 11724]|uniref:Bifunctional oligoribonuclease and PAP phosphatase nrnA n=2 Tax=Sphingobacterium mizutaii TaxID=1010 RepID=A0AAJ5C1B9_9SPHI|nr:bifunctional oligoribonuclease/PAP phosphatase NrnA [Sphingobacterium mizutaii]GEM69098.1 exopolyphosphatase [Sphingobacterium mizutaii NBRC 14946 = DSM 11724]SDL86657.1 phosphoesterase RecJ domain-containing protein [Sphingobacterium mizutaii]SNV55377.1 Bifunctional oligoribonuclease and PAP phosphatase nrnA [Sphingobacterium mizutaii]